GVARGSASDDLRDSAVNGSRPGTPLSRTSSFARTSAPGSRRRAPAAGPQAGRPTLRSALRDRIAGLEAGDPLIPEVGVADADLLGFEHRVQTELHLALEVAQELEGRLLQDEDADDVQPGHEAHADVTERPRAARGRDRTDGDGDED